MPLIPPDFRRRKEQNMAKEFKRKTEIEYISTWENLKYYIEIGEAREFLVRMHLWKSGGRLQTVFLMS